MNCNLRYTHHHSGGALFSGELAGEEDMNGVSRGGRFCDSLTNFFL